MKKFVYAIAIIALSVSSCQDLTVERSNKVIKVGKVSIANSTQVTKASSGTNVTNDGDVIVEESIEASETPLTKAGEINTVNFEQFFLDGFLDVSIKDKVAADPRDKANLNFMKGAEVKKEDASWSLNGEYYWRNLVDHYFWAYAGSVIDLEPVAADDFTSMKFSFDASSADSDLIIAGPVVKGGDIDHSSHGSDCTIDALVFNHALAEIVVDPSGLVAKEEGKTIQKDRVLNVKTVLPSVYGEADCEASSASFNWTVYSGSKFNLVPDVNEPCFVIPQEKPSVIELVVTDELTGVTFPHVASLASGSWENGKRYKYFLKSDISVPKYINDDDADITGFRFDASGHSTTGALVGDLQSKYIKSVDIEWTGVPYATTGSGTYLLLYLAQNELSNINPDSMINNPNPQDNSYKLIYGCSIGSHGWQSTIPVAEPTSHESAANTKVSISAFELPEAYESCTLFAYYKGATSGHQGKDNIVALKGLNVTINERRY